jgi:hypothetical protein
MALRFPLVVACAGLVLVLPLAASAQPGRPARGPADDGRLYDQQTVETVAGEVVEVFLVESQRRASALGAHMRVRTPVETIAVHLGPMWFIEAQDLEIKPGERVLVTGSRVTIDRQPAILAATVQLGDGDALIFRDEDGFPRWSVAARRRPGAGARAGWWRGADYVPLYDPASIEVVHGTIVEMGFHTPRYMPGLGWHLTLRTADDTRTVHLGPDWFLRRQDFPLAAGDEITVTGSRVEFEGKPILIAGEVRRGEEVLELRDARGVPRWTASRQARGVGAMRGGGGALSRDGDFTRMFDPAKMQTLQGQVSEVLFLTPPGGMGRGVHLTLQTDAGDMAVHLGPEWFIENQELLIEKGDHVSITGSLITFDGKPLMIARAVRKGRDILELRDERGVPRWRGWRRDAAGA